MMDALELCNGCDAAPALEAPPEGYCSRCERAAAAAMAENPDADAVDRASARQRLRELAEGIERD